MTNIHNPWNMVDTITQITSDWMGFMQTCAYGHPDELFQQDENRIPDACNEERQEHRLGDWERPVYEEDGRRRARRSG